MNANSQSRLAWVLNRPTLIFLWLGFIGLGYLFIINPVGFERHSVAISFKLVPLLCPIVALTATRAFKRSSAMR